MNHPGEPDSRSLEADAALRAILEGTATETGAAFFDAFVRKLASALHVKYAWVTEWLEDDRRLRALSFWADEDFYGEYEYDIAGTPCEPVIEDRCLIHVPDRLIELHPDDPDLPPLNAVSYMGLPLADDDGSLLGHLAVMDDRPMPANEMAEAIFHIFAGRAASELRRLRRERALAEREQKLSRLFGSAMDAILELDESLQITAMNEAAERAFGCALAHVEGKSFGLFLDQASRGKLSYLKENLSAEAPGKQSSWIPGGLQVTTAGRQSSFPAEATISRFEAGGRTAYVLILRNVHERQEAEARIHELLGETAYLREELRALHGFDEIVGESAALRAVLNEVEKVAPGETTVLITGETGTGKELIARAIHERSSRAGKPMVRVNCAAISPQLVESEFFGHEKGAFTGATQRREGRFRLAHRGTIFLDEVGELPLDLQSKLLRVLQEGEFEAVGSSRTEIVDVRVIAATNRELQARVEAGEFREDLFYRLNVFPIAVPPLRERGDDVVLLAESFAGELARRHGVEPGPLSADDKAKLRRYDWPGNVRELHNVIERALITSRDGRRLELEHILPDTPPRGTSSHSGDELGEDSRVYTSTEWQDLERRNLLRALEASGWKISGPGGAAERLGVHPNTLSSRMKILGLERPRSGS